MEDIRKKMESLRSETQNALNRAAQLEVEAKEANSRADKTEELVLNIFTFLPNIIDLNSQTFLATRTSEKASTD